MVLKNKANKDPKSHEEWLELEGGVEKATKKETIEQKCQQKRIQWLSNCAVGRRVLELGCNWGYILEAVSQYLEKNENKKVFGCGVDLNKENIERARRAFPNRFFVTKNIIKPVEMAEFIDNSFDTIMLPDVLEHLNEGDIPNVLFEVLRIVKRKILITLPLEEKKRHCFKHKWIVDKNKVYKIGEQIKKQCKKAEIIYDNDDDFYYITVNL